MRPIIITLLLCSGLALSACGQKGALYLPDSAQHTAHNQAQDAPSNRSVQSQQK